MATTLQNSKEKVRSELLETAARHFALYGLEGANIVQIALEAGYARGTVYNYFENKESLFVAVLSEACQRIVERYVALKPADDTTRSLLRSLAAADMSILHHEEDYMQVLIREAMSFRHTTYPLIIEHLSPLLVVLEKILARGVERQEVRTDKPLPQLALSFIGLLSLLCIQHWGSGGAWPPLEEIPDLVVSLFLDGAGPTQN